MTGRYTKIVSEQIPMCKGQNVLSAILLPLQEKASLNLEKNGLDQVRLDNAMQELEDKTAGVTIPVCKYICTHAVGSCVFREGVTVDNPMYQTAADATQEQVALLASLTKVPANLLHASLTKDHM